MLEDNKKPWYTSKILLANTIAFIAFLLQFIYGKVILTPELQGMILTLLNIILRAFTNKGIT